MWFFAGMRVFLCKPVGLYVCVLAEVQQKRKLFFKLKTKYKFAIAEESNCAEFGQICSVN